MIPRSLLRPPPGLPRPVAGTLVAILLLTSDRHDEASLPEVPRNKPDTGPICPPGWSKVAPAPGGWTIADMLYMEPGGFHPRRGGGDGVKS